jgi:hypothetical protein
MRSTYCESFRSPGISEGLLPISRTMIGLPMSWAAFSSALPQADASHSGLMSARTTSQRCAAFCSAAFQRSPAAMPRSGSRSRKKSSQPFPTSQSRNWMARSLLALE